jgi:hypothetical protein
MTSRCSTSNDQPRIKRLGPGTESCNLSSAPRGRANLRHPPERLTRRFSRARSIVREHRARTHSTCSRRTGREIRCPSGARSATWSSSPAEARCSQRGCFRSPPHNAPTQEPCDRSGDGQRKLFSPRTRSAPKCRCGQRENTAGLRPMPLPTRPRAHLKSSFALRASRIVCRNPTSSRPTRMEYSRRYSRRRGRLRWRCWWRRTFCQRPTAIVALTGNNERGTRKMMSVKVVYIGKGCLQRKGNPGPRH